MSPRNRAKPSSAIAEKTRVRTRKTKRDRQIPAQVGARARANVQTQAPPPLIEGVIVRRPKVGRLKTLANWRKELSRVYRAMRRGEMEPEVGTKLAFVAVSGAKMAKDEEELQVLRELHADVVAVRRGALPALPAPTLEDEK